MESDLLAIQGPEEVAEHAYISPMYLQKGFQIMTGFSLGEYMRSRKLYLAAMDFINTDQKVIDIAFKYGYETPESFTKAFTRFHDATPSDIRKKILAPKVFLPLKVSIVIQGGNDMDYTVEQKKGFKVIGFVRSFNDETSYAEIPKFWDEVKAKYCQNIFAGKEPAGDIEKAIVENESYECITTKLICPSSIPDSAISVQYFSQNYDLIEDDGTIHNQSLTKEEESSIIVQYRYGDKMEEEEIPMVIFPRKLSKEGKMVQAVKEKLKKLEQDSIHSPVVVIPKTIEQCGILLAQEEKSNVLLLFFGGLFIAGLLYMQQEEALKKQVKQRNDQLLRDYPELVNKLVLLLGAGMTMKGAITKMAMDYKRKREQSGKIQYLYEEMLVMMYEFQSGGSELQVYYNFGRRIKLAPYLKFTTLILQNLKKGAKDLTHMLEQEELVAFAGRKERAKVLGEEAGSKLLLPMMLILIMIIIMIMFPALSSFSV